MQREFHFLPTIVFVFVLSISTNLVQAQCIQTDTMSFSDIRVKPWGGDSLSSGFIISIPHSVPLHRHDKHSEYVVVVSGSAMMTLGQDSFLIRTGSLVWIPKNKEHSVRVLSKEPLQVVSIQAPYFDGTDRILIPIKKE